MPVIEVNQLAKTFQVFSRREGIVGSFRDLLHRRYRPLKAVDDISFSVEEGELLGFIGPNGAGKSTTIKMLTGILKPTSGNMSVMGYHPFKQRKLYTKHIGVVFGQRTQLWWDIAVIESFRLLGKIYEVPGNDFQVRLERFTEMFAMEELLHTPVRKLSLGQRIRCDLVASLLHDPKVLFLDEPTIGLDAVAKDSVRRFLKQVNRELKTTIILTTHDLQEIEELCRRIIIIDHGKIIYDGDLERVKQLPGLTRELVVDFHGEVPEGELSRLLGDKVTVERENLHRARASFDPQQTPTVELLKQIVECLEIKDISVEEPSIEDVVRKIYVEGRLE